MIKDYNQLEIYWVDLDPTKGSKTKKKMPCAILQSSLINKSSRTLIVCPILPGHKSWPFVVNVTPSSRNGIDKDRHLNLKQIRVIDVSRIDSYQGALEFEYLDEVKKKICLIFDI